MLEKLIHAIVKPFAHRFTGIVVGVRYGIPRWSLEERNEWDDRATQHDDFGNLPQIVTYRTHSGEVRTNLAIAVHKKIEESQKREIKGYMVERDGTLTALEYKNYSVGDNFP